MPELPEVETVRRGLLPAMDGQKITLAEVRRPDLRWPFPPRMADRLTGATVTRLGRRSKYLVVDLSSGETLLWHLGMSGRVLIEGDLQGRFHHSNTGSTKHDHVVFHMGNGAQVTFNDARRFGAMDLTQTATVEAHPWLAKLGPEPLGNAFSEDTLIRGFAGKKTSIKAALLDQRIVAGLGNIYVCEALFRAGISPKRQAGRISAARLGALVPIIRQVLAEAIEAGGSSLQDHRQPSGELGYFQHSFKVYDREDDACVTPGCDARIRRIVQSGRSSFYCGQCQR